MNRVAAANFLGVSLRTFQRYVQDGKIAFQQVNGRPDFMEEELSRFRIESGTPIHVPRKEVSREILDILNERKFDCIDQHLEAIAHYYRLSSLQQKLVLTLSEAQEISGLSQSFLVSKIHLGNLKARKLGQGWKVRLSDLQKFIDLEFMY